MPEHVANPKDTLHSLPITGELEEPWLNPPLQRLLALNLSGRLPHGLMIQGQKGLGKARLVDRFIAALLCQSPTLKGDACGACSSCNYYRAGNHPDARLVEPETEQREYGERIRAIPLDDPASKGPRKSRQIGVNQIREVGSFVWTHSQMGGRKVVVIAPAENMNINASNALLKSLEEPGRDAVLILISERPSGLPATIRSRCQSIMVETPSISQSLPWLEQRGVHSGDVLLRLSSGSPLTALELARQDALMLRQQALKELETMAAGRQDPVAMAETWSKRDIGLHVQFVHGWVSDMIRLRLGQEGDGSESAIALVNPDLAPRLRALAGGLDLQELYRRYDALQQTTRLLDATVSEQALLEEILLPWGRPVTV